MKRGFGTGGTDPTMSDLQRRGGWGFGGTVLLLLVLMSLGERSDCAHPANHSTTKLALPYHIPRTFKETWRVGIFVVTVQAVLDHGSSELGKVLPELSATSRKCIEGVEVQLTSQPTGYTVELRRLALIKLYI